MTSELLKNELNQQAFMRIPATESWYVKDEVKMSPKYINSGQNYDMALLCVNLKQGRLRAGSFVKYEGVPYIVTDTNAESNPRLFQNVTSVLLRRTKY